MAFQRSEYQQLRPHLDGARSACIVTHINADGDGAGSGIALCRFLISLHLEARFVTSGKLSTGLQFLDTEGLTVPFESDSCSPLLRDADLIFTVDNSSVSRLGPLEADVRAARGLKICIDHHVGRNSFWDLNLIKEEACATGEMIYDLIQELGGTVDRQTGQALYVAIATDTGQFRFPKTSAHIHRMVAEFLDLGVRPEHVYGEVHERNSPEFVKLLGESLLRLQSAAGGRICWVTLPATLLDACQAHGEDTSEVINLMLSIDGVEIGLLFRESGDDQTKISLRSKPQHDINVLAQANGGGGHRNAAGAVVKEPLETCARRVVAAAVAMFD